MFMRFSITLNQQLNNHCEMALYRTVHYYLTLYLLFVYSMSALNQPPTRSRKRSSFQQTLDGKPCF